MSSIVKEILPIAFGKAVVSAQRCSTSQAFCQQNFGLVQEKISLKQLQAHSLRILKKFFKDIDWFLTFLPHFNGRTFFNKGITHVAHDLFLDACLSGVGALWKDRVYASPVQDIPNFSPTIVHLEMINLVIALRMWGKFWSNSVVTAHCDNIAVVQVVDNSRTRDSFLAACIRNIWLLTAKWDIQLKIIHIPGEENVHADTLSRLFSSKAINQGLLNDLETNYTWDVVPIRFFTLDLQI